MTTDKFLGGFDTSAASLHKGASPYRAYPERETYKRFGVYARPDGSRYVKVAEVSRWGGEFDVRELETRDISATEYPQYV